MILLLSSSKRLDFSINTNFSFSSSQPDFLDKSHELIENLRILSPKDHSNLLNLSPKLLQQNIEWIVSWHLPFGMKNAKPALFAFSGDVFLKLNARNLSNSDLKFANDHIRIISGLYGLLKPFDLIMPYRLEMGTHLKTRKGTNLYDFWGETLVNALNDLLMIRKPGILINLTSYEYFKAIHPGQIKGRIVTPVFKDFKNGQYKVLALYAKYARGLMTRFILQNQVTQPEDLKLFDKEGYAWDANLSSKNEFVFTR